MTIGWTREEYAAVYPRSTSEDYDKAYPPENLTKEHIKWVEELAKDLLEQEQNRKVVDA